MVKICQTGLLKLNFETSPKKRIFRFLPKISAGHGWSWKIFFANFQILGPLGCQGWVVIPQNVKKSQNHCTLVTIYLMKLSHNISRGHYLTCNTYCLVLACIKATIHIRPLRFCHDLANIKENSYASFQIFHNNKI
jgi:hypothetical protein